MVVYCVVFCDDEYGHRHLEAVFANRADAEKYADIMASPQKRLMMEPKQWAEYSWDYGYWVQEMEVLTEYK